MNFELNIDGVSVDEIGIKTDRTDFTEQELDALVAYAGTNYNAAKWLIADMAALLDTSQYWKGSNESRTGKSAYDDLSNATGYSKHTLKVMARMSRRIPRAMRRNGVSFTNYYFMVHYHLSEDDIKTISDKCAKEKLTRAKLIELLRERSGIQIENATTTSTSNRNAKTINYIWRNRNAIKKLHKVVDELDVVEASEAMGAIEPYFRAFQAVMGRLLYLQNATDGLQDDKLNKAVANAQSNNETKIKR